MIEEISLSYLVNSCLFQRKRSILYLRHLTQTKLVSIQVQVVDVMVTYSLSNLHQRMVSIKDHCRDRFHFRLLYHFQHFFHNLLM